MHKSGAAMAWNVSARRCEGWASSWSCLSSPSNIAYNTLALYSYRPRDARLRWGTRPPSSRSPSKSSTPRPFPAFLVDSWGKSSQLPPVDVPLPDMSIPPALSDFVGPAKTEVTTFSNE